jgi:hypothetical protein
VQREFLLNGRNEETGMSLSMWPGVNGGREVGLRFDGKKFFKKSGLE